MLKKILPLALWLTATVAAFGQNAVMVNKSNSIITYPSNFWTANALVGRSGLGFNTNLSAFWDATNAATARTAIGALATNGSGSALTGLTASNITGTLAITNGGSGATTAGGARTNLGLGATNAVQFAGVSVDGDVSVVDGNIRVLNGTNEAFEFPNDAQAEFSYGINFLNINAAAETRTNLSLGASWLTNTTAADFRTAIGALATNGDGSGLTNLPTTSFSGTLAISNGGSGATTAGGARTNFGLGWSALTSPQSSLYSGTATTLLGYMPEIIAGGTNPSGFNVLAYTNTNGLVIPANLMIGEDLAPAPRNLRHVEIRGTATIGNPYTDDTILGANYASVTDQANFTNTIATWSSNALTMEMPIAFSTNTAAATTRANLGLGTAATNPASAFQPSSSVLTNLANNDGSSLTNLSAAGVVGILATNGNGAGLTNLTAANITGTVALASNVTGTIAISNGGSGATTAGGARTNFGLTFSALTNSDSNSFRSAIGLGISNSVSFESVSAINGSIKVLEGTNEVVLLNSDEASYFANPINFLNTNALNLTRDHLGLKRIVTTDQGQSVWITFIYDDTNATNPIISVGGQAGVTLYGPIGFSGAATVTNRALSRNNLGLGWSALTNTNTSGFNASLYGNGTNPVLYNTNGEVVSPTNFWQVAPIVTRFVESQPVVNQTTNITAARSFHIHSLAISTTGVTNTIALPTNNSFNGDIALVVHQGPTSSVTQVRTAGAATNLVTLNQPEEAVEFVYYNNVWQFNHNPSFTEPIYFSGTNAAGHAAESRTNLGLGGGITTNLVLKNSASQDTYLNFSNGILKYGSTTPP